MDNDAKLKTLEKQLETSRYLLRMGLGIHYFRHDINNGLVAVRASLENLRNALESNESSENIIQRLDRIESLAAEMLQAKDTSLFEEDISVVNINAFVLELSDKLNNSESWYCHDVQVRTQLDPSDPLRAHANPFWLGRAIDMLVNNAVKAMARCPIKILTLTTIAIGGNIEIQIADKGPGVPADTRGRLFKERIQHGSQERSGIGLLLANEIILGFGGYVHLSHSNSDGSIFAISLPKA
jgi:signal transduction histidine kinase